MDDKADRAATAMAAAAAVKIPEYQQGTDFASYWNLLEYLLLGANITDDEAKKVVLFSRCGAATFQLLCVLIQPRAVKDVAFNEIGAVLLGHYKPERSVLVCRLEFQRCRQHQDQTVLDYVKDLKAKASVCEFGATFDERLRDQLIFGLHSEATVKRLLGEKSLKTFTEAVRVATGLESAAAAAMVIQGSGAQAEVVQQVHAKRTWRIIIPKEAIGFCG